MSFLTPCPACYMDNMGNTQDSHEELMRLVSAMYEGVVHCVTPGHWSVK